MSLADFNMTMIEVCEAVLVHMKEDRVPKTDLRISEELAIPWQLVRKALRWGEFADQKENMQWELLPHVPKVPQKSH